MALIAAHLTAEVILVVTVYVMYWAIQAGLLTPLTLPGIAYVPWLLLLPVRTFFTMEGDNSEFANFTLPTLKTFLEDRSQNVSGNKQ